jgi:hypothetical protein
MSFAYNGYQLALIVEELFGDPGDVTSESVIRRLAGYRSTGERGIRLKQSDENGRYFAFPIGIHYVQ